MDWTDNKRVSHSSYIVIGEFCIKVLADSFWFFRVYNCLLSGIYCGWKGMGMFREVHSSICKVGQREGERLVHDKGNGNGSFFPVDGWICGF